MKRLTASFVIAGRANGFKKGDCREAAWLAAQSCRQSISKYGSMPVLEAWYDAMDMEEIIANMRDKQMKRFYTKKLDSAQGQATHEKEFTRLTYAAGNAPRIIDQPPLIFHYDDTRTEAFRSESERATEGYLASLSPERRVLLSRYRLADVAVKVVGVGSVGTFCGIALFISGNGDPPLPLPQLRARREMTEFRFVDLRFSPDEARAFLQGAVGGEVGAEAAALLVEKAEGWIVGLRLAALSMGVLSDDKAFAQRFKGTSSTLIVEYLASEVLARQSPEIQDFVLSTSVLDRFCAPLCEVLTGDPCRQESGDHRLDRAGQPVRGAARRRGQMVPLPSPVP